MHVAVLQKTNQRVTANFPVLGFTVVETTYTSANTRSLGSNTANIGLHDMAMCEVSFTPVSYSKCLDFDSRFVSRLFWLVSSSSGMTFLEQYLNTCKDSSSSLVLMSVYCRSCTLLWVWRNVIKACVSQENSGNSTKSMLNLHPVVFSANATQGSKENNTTSRT
jgi:hypothetical protein